MSAPPLVTRREALKCAALAAAALSPLARAAQTAAAPESSAAIGTPNDRKRGVRLSVATISLRDLSVPAAAAVLKQLEIPCVSIYRTHAPFETGTPEACRSAADTFRQAGLQVATTSVVNLTGDEAAMRRAFENVRAAGIDLMTCRPTREALPRLGKYVEEFGIRLAIHNHGPEDKLYASPYDALQIIETLNPRIGLCLDVGHTMRANVDPAEAIRRCAHRLYDLHLKDSVALPGAEDIPVEVGRGRMNIPAILAAVIDVNYQGVVAFEYERLGVNPTIGLAESVGYVRGVLGSLKA